jgi:hypothetical protein
MLSSLSGLTVEDNMILSEWLLPRSLELVLIDLSGVFIVESQHSGDIGDPGGTEGEKEVLSCALLHSDLVPRETEAAALRLVKYRSHRPFLL